MKRKTDIILPLSFITTFPDEEMELLVNEDALSIKWNGIEKIVIKTIYSHPQKFHKFSLKELYSEPIFLNCYLLQDYKDYNISSNNYKKITKKFPSIIENKINDELLKNNNTIVRECSNKNNKEIDKYVSQYKKTYKKTYQEEWLIENLFDYLNSFIDADLLGKKVLIKHIQNNMNQDTYKKTKKYLKILITHREKIENNWSQFNIVFLKFLLKDKKLKQFVQKLIHYKPIETVWIPKKMYKINTALTNHALCHTIQNSIEFHFKNHIINCDYASFTYGKMTFFFGVSIQTKYQKQYIKRLIERIVEIYGVKINTDIHYYSHELKKINCNKLITSVKEIEDVVLTNNVKEYLRKVIKKN